MNSQTQSVRIAVAPEHVYGYVSDAQNLPQWATGFAKSVRAQGSGTWKVETPQGEVGLQVTADPNQGVIDFWIEPAPGIRVLAASRVVGYGGVTEFMFTQFQPPGMPDAVFESQVEAARTELDGLKTRLESRA
jgi:uncharacterized protein YndB with AHSA1/START domain